MSDYSENIPLPELETSEILALAYGCFQQLGWTMEFATAERLEGYSKKEYDAYYDHISIDAKNGLLTISSELPEGSTYYLPARNKRNVVDFLKAFEEVRVLATDKNKTDWTAAIEAKKNEINIAFEKEVKKAHEINAFVDLTSGRKIATYSIIGINVLVFIIMVCSGVNFFAPGTEELIRWGADYKPYTVSGEWWRLITAMFLHFGIIHIAFNMYALFMVGLYLEPILGRLRYTAAYLCTGVFASIASIWWHGDRAVGAGASGAIFGMYGLLIALLTTSLIPKTMRNNLMQSMGIFVLYNLIYGAKSGSTDNAAHLGGLLSGFVVGYIYFLSLKAASRIRPAAISLFVLGATVLCTVIYLNNSSDDNIAYQKKVDMILELQDSAMAAETQGDNPAKSNAMMMNAKKDWQLAHEIIDGTMSYELDKGLSHHRSLLREYIDLRIKYTDLKIKRLQGHEVDAELDSITSQINEKVNQMK
jgi:rhomboid protease GluP